MPGNIEATGDRSLRQLLDERGRLPWRLAVDIAGGAAEALGEIHEAGRIHGSIRPDAVLIHDDGSVDVEERDVLGDATSTDEMDIATTDEVAYLSPEQVQAHDVDSRSDLYSLGVVLFEMLADTVPFRGSSPTSAAYSQATKPPPQLDEINPDVPSQVSEVVAKSLAKDPDQRYQTSRDMARALSTALAVTASPAPEDDAVLGGGSRDSGDAPVIRRWGRVALAAMVLLVTSVATAGLLSMPEPDDPSTSGAMGDDLEAEATTSPGQSLLENPLSEGPDPGSGESPPTADASRQRTGTTSAPTPTIESSTSTTVGSTTTTDASTTSVPTTTTTVATTTTTTAATTTTQASTTSVPTTTTTVATTTTTQEVTITTTTLPEP